MPLSEKPSVGEGKHSLELKRRERLTLDGVEEVISFDEGAVVLRTSLGRLTVEGDGLHVTKLLLDCGEVSLEGRVRALIYDDGKEAGRGLFHRFS